MFTKKSEGVFVHDDTGFMIHEAYSVDDLVDANGAFAVDFAAGTWGWVAGHDLRLEVLKFGGTSLRTLAQNILREYNIIPAVISGGTIVPNLSWGGMNIHTLGIAGIKFGTPCSASDLRIFALINNLHSGRGSHPSKVSWIVTDREKTSISLQWYIDASAYGDTGGITLETDPNWGFQAQDTAKTSGPALADGCLGRGIVNMPYGTWESYAAAWRDELPDSGKPEMAERALAATTAVSAVALKEKFGIVPTVRAPFAIHQGIAGKPFVGAEGNAKPNPLHGHVEGKPVHIEYPFYSLPSVREVTTGFWITNPCHSPQDGWSLPSCQKQNSTGLWSSVAWADKNVLVTSTPALSSPSSIGGVDLLKVFGGLHPYVGAPGDMSVAAAAQAVMEDALTDRVRSSQEAEESNADYQARLEATYSTIKQGFSFFPSCWAFAGQPAKIAAMLWEDALHTSKKLTVAEGALHSSGHYIDFLRQPSTGTEIRVSGSALRGKTFDLDDIQPVV